MEEQKKEELEQTRAPGLNVEAIVQKAITEYMRSEQARAEPAYKTELLEERRRREQLEKRVNELVEENKRSRAAAEEAERSATIRSELQRLGVAKIDLAFKAVKDEIYRGEDGQLRARTPQGEAGFREYLAQFVNENSELLPARMAGGSGAPAAPKVASGGIDLERIRPGMDPEELDRVRQEIARVAGQMMRGM